MQKRLAFRVTVSDNLAMTKREQDRIAKLVAELGCIHPVEALKYAIEMRQALRVIHTWLSFDSERGYGAYSTRAADILSVTSKALNK